MKKFFVLFAVLAMLTVTGCAATDPEMPTKTPPATTSTGGTTVTRPLEGKTVVFLGDSIFGNDDTDTGVVRQFARLTGATCCNFAFGGTKAKSRRSGDEWSLLDGEKLVQAIVNDDYTSQKQALTTIETSMVELFAQRLTAMETFDWSTADYLVCNWGTNDWFGGESVADYTAAMQTIFRELHTKFPHLRLVKCTPTPRFIADGEQWISGDDWHQKYTDRTLTDFVQADLDTEWGASVTVVNCYDMGITADNRTAYFNATDGTHPNAKGNALVAARLAEALAALR